MKVLDNEVIFIPIIMLLVIITSIDMTYARPTEDPGIGCGNRLWGERSHQNDYNGDEISYGRDIHCNTSNYYEGRSNTAVITTQLSGITTQYDIAWQTIYQGTTPWGENSQIDGGAVYDNILFPAKSYQMNDYYLKSQWVWTQDESPNYFTPSIHVNYLTNFWFVYDDPNTTKEYVVIDFMWDQLKENTFGINWVQNNVLDKDNIANGIQYYTAYCEDIIDSVGTTVTYYHYNVILDSRTTNAETWNEKFINIDDYIDDAFLHTYTSYGNCNDRTPSARYYFEIVDHEAGIEIQAQSDSSVGAHKGAYSFNELSFEDTDPVIYGLYDISINEDVTTSITVYGIDYDGDAITYSLTQKPSFVSISGNTITISPDYSDSGTYSVTVRATANGLSSTSTFQITVNNIDRAPSIYAISDISVNENETSTVSIVAFDPDGDAITYSLTQKPSFVSISGNTITISPDYSDSGQYFVQLSVNSNNLVDTDLFIITVNNIDRAPSIYAISDTSVNENETSTVSIVASDSDGDAITYSLTQKPSFVSISGNTITISPDYSDFGTYSVTVRATANGLSSTSTFQITVNNIDRAPSIYAISDISVNENETSTVSIVASDSDGDAITYSLTQKPSFVSISGNTITISPDYSDFGTYSVTVRATANGLSSTSTFQITVNNIDRAPSIYAISDISVNENETSTVSIVASDSDGDAITYSLTQKPSFVSISGNTITISPDYSDSGSYSITVIATSHLLSDNMTFTVTVHSINTSPIIDNTSIQSNEDTPVTIILSGNDLENNTLTFQNTSLPSNGTLGMIIPINFSSSSILYIPNENFFGIDTFTYSANDGTENSDIKTVTINIVPVNDPPNITTIPNYISDMMAIVTFNVTVIDIDDDSILFSLSGAPIGATINNDGLFTWKPSIQQIGTFEFVIVASDGMLMDNQTISITVTAPIPHISSSNTNNLYAKAGDTVTITLNVTESISNVTAIILDRNASFFIDADTINVTQNITTNDTNGPVTFDIYLNTTSNEIKHVTQDNLTVNVIIDTIKPVITINGNNLEFWMQNTAYSDAGSFVLDTNNTSYHGTVYSNSRSLNASLLGIHLISYSADADQAGNIPDNKTRTVTVFNTDPYTISSLNITSNNLNSHYAKAGDNIMISLQADKLIQNANITIENQQAIPHIDGNNLIANLTIHENTTNGNVAFNITLIDVLTVTQISELNLTDPNVYIDTMSPIITISSENVTIERGTAYVDTGVTIFDNDPTYNGIVSSNVSSININTVGSYLIEYHAPSDLAGNVPNNVTKMVTIQDTKHPTITILNITTNNPSGTHAAANQKLTITLETNEILTGTNATILNQAITMNVSGTSASASVTIPENYPANNATFSIAVRDAQNNTLYVTEANLTSNNIFIDTEKPVITLTGPANIIIERGIEYVDTGATISDNDPAYNGIISSNATSLDTNIPGEHIISYQATNDAAGNEAANATRLVTVLYTAPSQISASIKSNNTDTMRAKVGDMLNITLTANKPISHAEGTIMGRMADTIIQNDTVHTTIIIKQEDVNGNATFSITIHDDFSNFTSNETTLDSANVLIDTVIPTKTSLTIHSNNSNTSRAKAGDVLNITLVTDERISDATIQILERNTAYVIQNDTIYANITVESYDSDNVTFAITAYDLSMNELTVSEFNLDSTNIFVDNTPPIIDLNGSDIVLVHTGSVYDDADVTVWDNDPGYAGSVTSNATLLGTSNGTYTLVYSAPPDPAGNEAKNATRTVIISPLLEIYNVAINTTNPNTGYAKENDTLVIRLESNMSLANAFVSATVFGRQADYGIYDQILYVNQTVKKGDNGYASFTILIQDDQGASMLITKDDLQKNIVVDTALPQVLSSTTITPSLVSVTFDEPIATHDYTILLTSVLPLPVSTNVKDGSSIPNSVLEIILNPTPPLSSNATPIITFSTSAILDLAGNSLQGTSITANDGIAPSLQSALVVSPALINVIFDEQIKLAPGYTLVFPTPTIDGERSSPQNSISGNTLSIISTTNSFLPGAVVNVSISGVAILDTVGNLFEPDTILTSAASALAPYTISETVILVPYATALDPNTISVEDYRVTFGSNLPSVISTTDLSNDLTTVILTMAIPFETGDTPLIEQPGLISDTLGNAITIQSALAHDNTPPTFVSVISSSTSGVTVTFSELLSSVSTNVGNYDSIGPEIRTADPGLAYGTVVMTTSAFVDAGIQVSSPVAIEDSSGNEVQKGALQNVVRNR